MRSTGAAKIEGITEKAPCGVEERDFEELGWADMVRPQELDGAVWGHDVLERSRMMGRER